LKLKTKQKAAKEKTVRYYFGHPEGFDRDFDHFDYLKKKTFSRVF